MVSFHALSEITMVLDTMKRMHWPESEAQKPQYLYAKAI